MLAKASLMAIPVVTLLVVSLVAFGRTRSRVALLSVIGAGFLSVVVLTHLAEARQWFPRMGWGQPDTAGHYLDLTSALAGATLLSVAFILLAMNRRGG